MGCFACFGSRKRIPASRIEAPQLPASPAASGDHSESESGDKGLPSQPDRTDSARCFTFRELAIATQCFNEGNLIGEGGFGKVFKGRITGKIVAVKQLNHSGMQGSKEFLMEVLMLSMLRHPNLVSLFGYCAEGDERLLVYEYMPQGSLADHLFDLSQGKQSLDWNTRVKIAVGIAKGLSYLHDRANPPIIYRDMKAANILLDNEFNPKLSDFGLAKVGPVGERTHVSTRVMGTYGYCAPDYIQSGKLTIKSDIYSFGVLLLELTTGRRVYDPSKPKAEQNLLNFAHPLLSDRRKSYQLADPALQGGFPPRAFHQLATIIFMCLQEQPRHRPYIRDVVFGLKHIALHPYAPDPAPSTSNSPLHSPQSAATPSRRRSPRSPRG